MNINHQFPPSSPLLNNDSESEDGFNTILQQKHNLKANFNGGVMKTHSHKDKDDAYLTPDPSSSLGDVTVGSEIGDHSMIESDVKSSPSKRVSTANVRFDTLPAKRAKTENHGKIDATQPLSIQNFKNVINIPLNGDTFKIGRSGLSCSFKLSSSNKLISRVHAEIKYEKNTDKVTLKCRGYNGINITIPQRIGVKHLQNQEYQVSISESQETDDEDTSNSRILNKNNIFTNFFMLKDESIQMPLIDGIVLDFRGELALLVFRRETLQLSSVTKKTTAFEGLKNLSAEKLLDIVEQKKTQFSTHPTLNEIQKTSEAFPSSASPIAKRNLSNTIVYKRPSPNVSHASSPMCSPSPESSAELVIKKDAEPVVEKTAEIVIVNATALNENTVPVTDEAVIGKENVTESVKTPTSVNEVKPTHNIERIPLADITNNKSTFKSAMDRLVACKVTTKAVTNKAEKVEKPKQIINSALPQTVKEATAIVTPIHEVVKPVISETKKLVIEKPQQRDSATPQPTTKSVGAIDTKTPSISVEATQLNTDHIKHKERSKSPELDTNDEHKKKGRPKKVKKTEEEILKGMPKEQVDQILSTIPELDDISNLITNHIAYSRVLQTPFSSLLELNSIKKHALSKLQLRSILIHHVDCIGVIFRQGKDAAGKPLDEEYYYVSERDSDKQRVMLVEDLKGSSSSIRSCRKTHKQYFWKKPKV